MELTKELITWILIVVGTNLSAVILAIISWIRAVKMIPRELEASDLDNKIKEASIAEQMDELATKAADKAIRLQERLDVLEKEHELLKEEVGKQKSIAREQADTIIMQNTRLDLQEKKIEEQEGQIETLKSDLFKAQAYNMALIKQMQEENMIPISMENAIENSKITKNLLKKESTKSKRKI